MSERRPGAGPVSAVREAAARFLHLPDLSVVNVALATLVGNTIAGDPLWVVLVSPPSNGKTELLVAASRTPKAYLLSTLTKNTLISGQRLVEAGAVQAADGSIESGRPEPSLLRRLDGKTLIVKDFGTILGLHRDEGNVILGLLREVYDGRVVKSFGTGKVFRWEGKMGFLAGVTPAFDRHSAVQAILGERFLLYRIPARDRELRREQARMALQAAGGEPAHRETLAKAMLQGYGDAMRWWEKNSEGVTVPVQVEDVLVALAELAAYGRAGVIRDGYNREVRYQAEPEGPARLVKQLRQLTLGLTVVQGKLRADEEELGILRKVAVATMHPFRARVLAALAQRDTAGTADLAKAAGLPYTTAEREIEDAAYLGLVEESAAAGRGRVWRLSAEARDDIERSGVFAESGVFADLIDEPSTATARPAAPSLSPEKDPPRGREGEREYRYTVGGYISGEPPAGPGGDDGGRAKVAGWRAACLAGVEDDGGDDPAGLEGAARPTGHGGQGAGTRACSICGQTVPRAAFAGHVQRHEAEDQEAERQRVGVRRGR